ncbi:MAG: PAS domain-containing protein [Dokdonella sp.]|nr:MAG: PAS domain-containing protein [Dokdonella sp.]
MRGRGRQARGWIVRAIALVLCCAAAAPAARAVPGTDAVRFHTFSTADGLPQATVRAIAQDATGFLWLGTQDGLARFDGYSFQVYRHERDDPWSLAESHVTALVADTDGSLWVGTLTGGLSHYDPDLDRFRTYRADRARSDTLASDNITALLLTRGGRLWVANTGGRLQWLDRTAGTLHDSGLGQRAALRMVRSMLELPDGSLLLGTLDGLWRLDVAATRLEQFHASDGRALDVYTLALDARGHWWVGTADAGMLHFDAGGNLVARYRHDPDAPPGRALHDDAVRALLFDPDGSLWIAGDGHGLARMDPAGVGFTRYTHDPAKPDSVAANRLYVLVRERSGTLVVGSWTNGFSIHDPRTQAFVHIESVAGDPRTLPARPVTGLHADADGTLWLGMTEAGGLVQLDPARGVVRRFKHDPDRPGSLAHDFVRHVTRGRDGSLWVSTIGGGIDRLPPQGNEFEHHRHDPADPASLASDSVLGYYEDSEGTQWIATNDRGVDERCAGCSGFRHHAHDPAVPDSISDNTVSAVLQTRDGSLWFATRGGLDRYDRASGRFQHLRARSDDPSSLSSNSISTLFEDSHGNLWIGTQGGGLNRRIVHADGSSSFEVIDTSDGLAAGAIGTIVEDGQGRIWVSTTVGISRIDAQRRIVNFSGRDGVQGLGYWTNSGALLPDGRIAFGGLDGATLFDPAHVAGRPVPTPMVVDLLLRNVPVHMRWRDPRSPLLASLWRGGQVQLAHDQSNVTFEFSAPSFGDTGSVQYAYRLDGHDAQWIQTSAARRFATYTDLPAGDYVLQLRARNDGGDWSDPPVSIDVSVAPAPWWSPSAWALYGLMAVALALLVSWRVRTNLRQRRAVQESIRSSEERLKLALWGSGSELWDVDLASGSMHRDNQLAHLAVSHDALEGGLEAYRPYVHPDDIGRFEQALSAHLRGDMPAFEASFRTLDTQRQWVWVLARGRVVARDAGGRPQRLSGTTSDANALNQALAALRTLNEQLESRVEQRTAALQNANAELRSTLEQLSIAQRQLFEAEKLASLGGLVAGIAHEINTPLGIGVTAASHLQEEAQRLSQRIAGGDLDADELARFERTARESAQMILRNLQRADRLVKSFKQVAVDQSSEERRVVDLGICLNEILTTLGPSLKKTPHHVELDCPSGLVVETAPGALYQIVSNLVMNSLTHAFTADAAGTITISVRLDGGVVCIDFGDDGRGMDEAVRARIFEPFFTTRRGQGGSGLGMHIVYSLVTQVLHGQIECDSAPGAGTRFRLRFGKDAGRPAG